MAKFSQIARGVAARKVVTFPLLGGGEATCAVVPLLAEADAAILREAREFAIERGVAQPRDGDPLYELGKWVSTLVHACVDVESPEGDPAPFFDGGAAQILDPKHGLDRDRIALLYEAQRNHQDDCAPGPKQMGMKQYLASVLEHALLEDDAELPFDSWPHAMRSSWVRISARFLIDSPQLKSGSGAASPDDSAISSISQTPPQTGSA